MSTINILGTPTTSHANLLNTTTPECVEEQKFCDLLRSVLKKTRSPTTKHSGGNSITASTKHITSANEETTTRRIKRNDTTHLSTLVNNDHRINTTVKPAIRTNGTTVTTKQGLSHDTMSPLSRLHIRTSTILAVNRVGVSVQRDRSTTTTWVDWIREVISKSSFNTSVSSRPPTKYDRKTVSNLH